MTEYTTATVNASDTITATATDVNATVTIESDDATIADGTATWADGSNVVSITVENGEESTVYIVTVLYHAEIPGGGDIPPDNPTPGDTE